MRRSNGATPCSDRPFRRRPTVTIAYPPAHEIELSAVGGSVRVVLRQIDAHWGYQQLAKGNSGECHCLTSRV